MWKLRRFLYKFLQISWPERWLLFRALSWLSLVTLGLRVVSLQALQRLLDRSTAPRAPVASAQRIAWAVRVASRFVPAATCLPQALTAQHLLARHGYPAELQIGAAKRPDGTLEAHAWLISGGEVVIGALPDLDRYVPLSPVQRTSKQEQTG